MNKEKMKNFIKENWVPIAIVAMAAVGTGTITLFCIKTLKSLSYTPPQPRQLSELEQAISGLKLDAATVTDAWEDDGDPWFILNGLKVSDLGKLGEELIEKVPGVDENTLITCDMGLLN